MKLAIRFRGKTQYLNVGDGLQCGRFYFYVGRVDMTQCYVHRLVNHNIGHHECIAFDHEREYYNFEKDQIEEIKCWCVWDWSKRPWYVDGPRLFIADVPDESAFQPGDFHYIKFHPEFRWKHSAVGWQSLLSRVDTTLPPGRVYLRLEDHQHWNEWAQDVENWWRHFPTYWLVQTQIRRTEIIRRLLTRIFPLPEELIFQILTYSLQNGLCRGVVDPPNLQDHMAAWIMDPSPANTYRLEHFASDDPLDFRVSMERPHPPLGRDTHYYPMLHLQHWDVSRLESMDYLFRWISDVLHLSIADVDNWDVSRVCSAKCAFYRVRFGFDVSLRQWKLPALKHGDYMIYGDARAELGFSEWELPALETKEYMFDLLRI